jgi:hypothetical protein
MNQTSSDNERESLDYSVWGDQYTLTAFKADPDRWNKDWEKALRTRTAAVVFTHMAVPGNSEFVPIFMEDMVGRQKSLVGLWARWNKLGIDHFITAWLLLDDKERKRHLMKGFEDSFPHVVGSQDARALAPEITTTALLKRNGKAFIEFLEGYVKAKDVGNGEPYFYPSEWWDKALEGVSESVMEKLDEHSYPFIAINRDDFISEPL